MRLGSYADWQLRQPATPRAMLDGLVRRATGREIALLDRIIEGYSNEVYRVETAGGDEVVIRILRFDDDVSMSRSADEAWAIGQARSVGVPTGEVLLLDSVSVDGADYPVMVQRVVPGRPLSQMIESLADEECTAVLGEIGRLVGRLGGIAVSPREGWLAEMAARLTAHGVNPTGVDPAGLDLGLTDSEDRVIFALLNQYVSDLARDPTVLSHGDLSTKHVFVDEAPSGGMLVSGVIDFGDWTPGPPVHDLAVLRVRNPELEIDPLLAGYRQTGPPISRRSLDLHTLVVALDARRFQIGEQDRAAVEAKTAVIHSLVRDLVDGDG